MLLSQSISLFKLPVEATERMGMSQEQNRAGISVNKLFLYYNLIAITELSNRRLIGEARCLYAVFGV